MGLFVEAAPRCQHLSISAPCEDTIDQPAQVLSRQPSHMSNAYPNRSIVKCLLSLKSLLEGGLGVIAKLGKHQSRHQDPAWRDQKKRTDMLTGSTKSRLTGVIKRMEISSTVYLKLMKEHT